MSVVFIGRFRYSIGEFGVYIFGIWISFYFGVVRFFVVFFKI